ncbi:MAG: hypothetical protein ACREFP_08075, partial [Acetobacteraceae bacterium]
MPRSTGLIFRAGRVGAGATLVATLLGLSGCWQWDTSSGSAASPAALYALSATFSGLNSSGLVLLVNGTAVSVAAGSTA